MELKEQVAYLRGLVQGQQFQGEKEEVLWTQLLNICDLISMELEEVHDEYEALNEYVEAIDEDLGDLEDHYYSFDEEDGEETEQLTED